MGNEFRISLTTLNLYSDNIALRKPAQQQYPYDTSKWGADLAVDGQKSDLSGKGGQCTLSNNDKRTAKWWVDLGGVVSIHSITIYYRTENLAWDENNNLPSRFLGFHVYVSNTTSRRDGHLCFRDRSYTRATIPAVVNIACPVHGQYVIYYNERLSGTTYPSGYSAYAFNELCEVEVYGCAVAGYYGFNCNLPCPDTNCRHCKAGSGACQACKPGYQGHRCEQACDPHYYGELCSLTCGNCGDGVTCNNVDGTCTNGCDVGVYGDKCKTPCPFGWHGKNCSLRCTSCDTCDRFTGQCTSPCYAGWKGTHCNEECNGRKYGLGCEYGCGACLDNKQCHHINGVCLMGCDAGYEGELCKTECSAGKFGRNCEQMCNMKCGIPNTCNSKTGGCEGGCQPGYEGLHCDSVCKAGYYGSNCTNECSLYCKTPRDCNHVTGHCIDGCIYGWQGVYCQEVEDVTKSSSFYGVLASLFVSMIANAVLGTYTYIMRRKQKGRHSNENCVENSSTKIWSVELSDVHEKTDEHADDIYQELGNETETAYYDRVR